MNKPITPHGEVILKLARNPQLAHAVLFGHRHPNETPEFHKEIIDLWHSDEPRVAIKAFRGAAKSTLAEEAIIIGACLRKFKNCIILGETEERAIERLRAIKYEFEHNEKIQEDNAQFVIPSDILRLISHGHCRGMHTMGQGDG